MSYSTYMNASVATSVVGINVVSFGDKRVICGESVYNKIAILAALRCLLLLAEGPYVRYIY